MATMTSIIVMPRVAAGRVRRVGFTWPSRGEPGPVGDHRQHAAARRGRSAGVHRRRRATVADDARLAEPGQQARARRVGHVLLEDEVAVERPLLPLDLDGDAPDGELEQRLERRVDEADDQREQARRAARAAEGLLERLPACSGARRRSRATRCPAGWTSRSPSARTSTSRRRTRSPPRWACRPRRGPVLRRAPTGRPRRQRHRLRERHALDLPVAREAGDLLVVAAERARVFLVDLGEAEPELLLLELAHLAAREPRSPGSCSTRDLLPATSPACAERIVVTTAPKSATRP